MTTQLYDLDIPDELSELDLKDAGCAEIIDSTYSAWLGFIEECDVLGFRCDDDTMYNMACRLVRPFKKQLTGTLTEKDIDYIAIVPHYMTSEDYRYTFSGHYLSALLNETAVEKLSLGEFPVKNMDIGYRLQPGKIVEIREDGNVLNIGNHAQGGVAIVHGNVRGSVGFHAEGGVFPVFGNIEGAVGYCASGGMFPVFGTVELSVGNSATGGMFPVCGNVKGCVGYDAEGGIFIAKPGKFVSTYMNNAFRVQPKELEKDAELGRLLDELEDACRVEKFSEVEAIGRRIDSHVRKNYKLYKERRF